MSTIDEIGALQGGQDPRGGGAGQAGRVGQIGEGRGLVGPDHTRQQISGAIDRLSPRGRVAIHAWSPPLALVTMWNYVSTW